MSMMSSAYQGPREIEYLFIDGGYLRKSAEEVALNIFQVDNIPIDFSLLGRGYTKSFYYDCVRPQRSGESDAEYKVAVEIQEREFNAIRYLRGFHVFQGTVKGRIGRTRQKQVDVRIAVDMLMHSHRKNMHKATLLTGDLDFKPLVDALVQDGMYVTLWHEPRSASKELVYAADELKYLSAKEIYQFCSKEFKEQFKIPGISHVNRNIWDHMKNPNTVRRGNVAGANVQLIETESDDSKWTMIFDPSPYSDVSPGNVLYVSHPNDRELLERYVEYDIGHVTWE